MATPAGIRGIAVHAIDFNGLPAYVALPMVSMAEWQAVHEQQFDAHDRDFVIYNTAEEKHILTANATTPCHRLQRSGPIGPWSLRYPAARGWAGRFLAAPGGRPCGRARSGRGGKYPVLGPGQEQPEG